MQENCELEGGRRQAGTHTKFCLHTQHSHSHRDPHTSPLLTNSSTNLEVRWRSLGKQIHEHGLAHPHASVHVQPFHPCTARRTALRPAAAAKPAGQPAAAAAAVV